MDLHYSLGSLDVGLGDQAQLYETYCKRRATTPRAKIQRP
jgi:hypothetical protein